jgi:hypothetical protein
MTVNNMGGSLGGLKLYLYSGDKLLKEIELDDSLQGHKLQTINVENLEGNFTKGELRTECPTVSLNFIQNNGILN